MSILDHLKSTLTIIVITVNLLLWLVPIIPLVLVKLLVPPMRASIDPALDAIYRMAWDLGCKGCTCHPFCNDCWQLLPESHRVGVRQAFQNGCRDTPDFDALERAAELVKGELAFDRFLSEA